jgi:hypothetical protein
MRLLEGEPDDFFAIFVEVLVEAARQWAEPVTEGEALDRPPSHSMCCFKRSLPRARRYAHALRARARSWLLGRLNPANDATGALRPVAELQERIARATWPSVSIDLRAVNGQWFMTVVC